MSTYCRLHYVYITSEGETAVSWEDHHISDIEMYQHKTLHNFIKSRIDFKKNDCKLNITKHSVKILTKDEYLSSNTW